MHGPGGVGRPILSQSEDQSRPHPVLTFVHPMSTQVRCLGPNAAESAHRSDPRIATRTRKRISGQVTNYPENWVKLFECVSRGRDRRLHHLDPRQKTPQTPFPGIGIRHHGSPGAVRGRPPRRRPDPGLRAPRSPGFLQPVCSTPGSGTEHQGASCSRNQFYSTCAIPICESTNRSISSVGLSVRPWAREAGRRAGRDGNPRDPAATGRPGRVGPYAPQATRPGRGLPRRAPPAGSCGARPAGLPGYFDWALGRATRPGSRPRP